MYPPRVGSGAERSSIGDGRDRKRLVARASGGARRALFDTLIRSPKLPEEDVQWLKTLDRWSRTITGRRMR
jgi:hypothetical protein